MYNFLDLLPGSIVHLSCLDANVTCPKTTDFKCRGSPKCVPSSYRCDKDNDCGDEPQDCEFGTSQCQSTDELCCGSVQFYCGSGECLNRTQVCDYESDCADASDELGCLLPTSKLFFLRLAVYNNNYL